MSQDISKQLQEQVKTALDEKTSLIIQGGNSKRFFNDSGTTNSGNSPSENRLNTTAHSGIINYQASELVVTARAGTSLLDINLALEKNNQHLAFEPPVFSSATLGGMMASGFSGPSRPFSGSVRDAVLGCKIINGHGDILRFGGEVVKNVAGYDVSRLMTGAFGTLGVLLEVSVKVLPKADETATFSKEISASKIIETMNKYRRSTLPISGMVYINNTFYIRLSSTKNSLNFIQNSIELDPLNHSVEFWKSIQEQTHRFFTEEANAKQNLWKILLPPASKPIDLIENSLIDWGGGLYWFHSDKSASEIHKLAKKHNGFAILFRPGNNSSNDSSIKSNTNPVHTADMLSLQQKIKHAFDPHEIFNPGKMI